MNAIQEEFILKSPASTVLKSPLSPHYHQILYLFHSGFKYEAMDPRFQYESPIISVGNGRSTHVHLQLNKY